ncbi:oxidoreductase [Klebsiella michiganensis]|uniref:Oxidoreductase n=1 Tax=Klebsiella michiganensis TaxID=1134687 RepID=A0A7H4M4B2_9ENTR|nr:oxidoreductase [Klebsiella michiganensis]
MVAEIEQKGVKAAALPLNVGDVAVSTVLLRKVREVLQQRWQRETFDYLLNNAGIGLNIPFAETSEAQFDELMNIQFKGPFFLTQRLLPLLQDGGRILNVSSGLARFALPGYAAYASMKGADGGADALPGEGAGRNAEFRSILLRPARLKPILAAVWSGITRR